MFSSLPKIADKTFVIAFIAPVLIGVIAGLIAFRDTAWAASILTGLSSEADLSKLTGLAGGVFAAALLLMVVNRPVYRLFEGYEPGWLMTPLSLASRRAWRRADSALSVLRAGATHARQTGAPDEEVRVTAYRRALAEFRQTWPGREDLVLPTRFGNANRAFESYPRDVYGVEPILIWPRLAAVTPQAQLDRLADARAQVDGCLNTALILAAVLMLRLGVWLAMGLSGGPPRLRLEDLAWSAAAAILARAAYLTAIERARAMGVHVMATFDLYLPDLQSKLGMTASPDPGAQQALWQELAETFEFHRRRSAWR